jgi:hypothetical protein
MARDGLPMVLQLLVLLVVEVSQTARQVQVVIDAPVLHLQS